MAEEPTPPLESLPTRAARGRDWYNYTMTFPALESDSAYRNAIETFVFAEMWSRPALDMKARRWITLACVASAGTELPIKAHFYAALKSGDISLAEMHEFTLHFAVYAGWPQASYIDQVVRESWEKVMSEGGIIERDPPAGP
jgi:4-carboxymuconolactone decarboxylase